MVDGVQSVSSETQFESTVELDEVDAKATSAKVFDHSGMQFRDVKRRRR
jgi:hypothetical protein